MTVDQPKLIHFLEGHDKSFIIPVYQRNYDWQEFHCKTLYEDLIGICKIKRESHFFGSIVYLYDDDNIGRNLVIIDGQQRITTVSLLLLALIRVVEEKNIEGIDIEAIRNEYLIGKYSHKQKMKLKPVREDDDAFIKLFESNNEKDYKKDSNITKNYLYFKKRLLNETIEYSDFLISIKKLNIVEIKLKKGEDDPQLIFESLNSTGLDLTEADKVRNFLLMNLEYKEQEKYYNDYWRPIEELTQSNMSSFINISSFIRDYITYKEKHTPPINKVYFEFKEFFKNQFEIENLESLFEELLRFAKYYSYIINSDYKNNDVPEEKIKKINEYLSYLNTLEVTVSYPFLLEVFNDFETEKIINIDEFLEVLKIIESYIFRRIICDLPANSLNKIFVSLGKEIKNVNNYDESNYVEILKHILTQKKEGNQKFPNDFEFEDRIINKDIYNMSKKNKLHLLIRLETFHNNESSEKAIRQKLDEQELTIEHIMPQTLDSFWKQDLKDKYGDEFIKIHEKYLNTLGNITLTGYNKEYGNKPFLVKKTCEHGFDESTLFLNQDLKKINSWDESKILNRASILKNKALNIWKYPKSSYKPPESTENLYSLNERKDFTGEKIKYFEFKGTRYDVNSWVDFYEKIILLLFDLDPIKFKVFLSGDDFKNKLSENKDKLRKPREIADNIFIESNLNVGSIINNVILMLETIKLNSSDVSVCLKEQ